MRLLLALSRKLARSSAYTALLYYVFRAFAPLRRRVVLVESHKGEDLVGNPYYILRFLATSDEFRHLDLKVVCQESRESALRVRLPRERITYCRPRSLGYYYHLATAKYLINDVAFPPYFSRRARQLYLNTWHGTPIKALGLRVLGSPYANMRNMQRNFLHATHIVFPNNHTEQVLRHDFQLNELWTGKPIRCGYPRNDILVKSRLEKSARVHVAYMPTWRGSYSTLTESSTRHIEDVEATLRELSLKAPPSVMIWVKLHPLMEGQLSLSDLPNVQYFPNDAETYEHLARCDALITDYSSVMIDFSAAARPVLLYAPDVEAYRQQQSFSLELNDLPFPRYESAAGIANALWDLVQRQPFATGNSLLSELIAREDGLSSETVCKVFFSGDTISASHDHQTSRIIVLLIEERLTCEAKEPLESIIQAVARQGFTPVIATPGEYVEDPILLAIVREDFSVRFCPSTASCIPNPVRMLSGAGSEETRRLFGAAPIRLVVHLDECRYYIPLARGLPHKSYWRYKLRDPNNVSALLLRLSALLG